MANTNSISSAANVASTQSSSRRPATSSTETKRRRLALGKQTVTEGRIVPNQVGSSGTNWGHYPELIRRMVQQECVPAPPALGTSCHGAVLPPLPCSWEQAFAAHVAITDRDIRPIRLAAFKVDELTERSKATENGLKMMAEELEATDEVHNQLVDLVHRLEARVDELAASVATAKLEVIASNEKTAAAVASAAAAEQNAATAVASAAAAEQRAAAAEHRAELAEIIATQAMENLEAALHPEPIEEEEPEEEEEEEDGDENSIISSAGSPN